MKQFRRSKDLWAGKALLSCLFLLCVAAISARAQDNPDGNNSGKTMSPVQGESDGVSAGGKWVEFRSEDKMTGAKKVRFELQSDNYLSQDPDYKPRVEIFCADHKYNFADFNPGIRLGPPNRPGFWGQPQLEVLVRIDETHSSHGWNWMRDRFLSMDKGTTRGLIGAQVFKIQLRGRKANEIAEFSPGGLNLEQVKQECDLTPKKPSND